MNAVLCLWVFIRSVTLVRFTICVMLLLLCELSLGKLDVGQKNANAFSSLTSSGIKVSGSFCFFLFFFFIRFRFIQMQSGVGDDCRLCLPLFKQINGTGGCF